MPVEVTFSRAYAGRGHVRRTSRRTTRSGQDINEKEANKFEGAVRTWAISDEEVAKVVDKVDQLRLKFIEQVFEEIGFHGVDCEMRARVFLHYEVAEPSIFLARNKTEHDELMRLRIGMLTSRLGDSLEERA